MSPVNKQLKQKLYNTATVCHWCGGPFTLENRKTIDHIVPRKLGGTNKHKNLVVACLKCNKAKDADDPRDWINRLARENREASKQILLDVQGRVFLRDFKAGTIIQVGGAIQCRSCQKYKHLSKIRIRRQECESCCRRETARAWRNRNRKKYREMVRKSVAKWKRNHPDEARALDRRKGLKHYNKIMLIPSLKRKLRKRQREWRRKNSAELNARRREKYKTDNAHREKIRKRVRERYATKKLK